MDDEQIKEHYVEMSGFVLESDSANWKGNVMKISLLKVILFNMTTLEDFAKGTKAHSNKNVIARCSERITETRREFCRDESPKEDLKTIKSCENLETSSASKDRHSDSYRIKQQAGMQNRKLGLLKNQRYWEEKEGI